MKSKKVAKDRVGAALVGCGGIAKSQHLPNLARAPNLQLLAVCDVDERAARAAQAAYAVPRMTTRFEEILADPEIDLVVVATKEDAQVELTCRALEAGKHVYVEKPLATTPEDCRKVVQAQGRHHRLVQVGFNRRFAPACREARRILAPRGGPTNIHFRISDEYWSWGRAYPPGVRVIQEACHVFDLLRWLADSEVASVYCASARPDDEIYALKFTSGCVATVMCTGEVTLDLPKERIELVTRRPGALIIEEYVELRTYGCPDEPPVFRFPGHTHPDSEATHKYLFEQLGAEALAAFRKARWQLRNQEEAGELNPHDAELRRFLEQRFPHTNYLVDKGWRAALGHLADCILGRAAFEGPGPRDALAANLLAHAAMRSRETGEVVRL
ncbi:MAG: Gfo/Idh/MocA family oxidoreductase [Verrucomicrobia bacterium]|nr:Gfo/Idh/MocA family oxidoreductase [Verrucomicrobiota bacterium]